MRGAFGTRTAGWSLAMVLGFAAPPVAAMDEVDSSQIKRATNAAERGNRALRTGNLTRARSHFERSLEILPDLPEGFVGLGHVRMRERRFEQALEAFERARQGYIILGQELFEIRQTRYQRAQNTALSLRSQAQRLRHQASGSRTPAAARMEAQARRLEQEAERLESMVPPRLDESHDIPGEIHFFIGNALLNLDRIEEAIESWETCARLDPGFPLVHNNLAVGYWRLNRLDRAATSLRKAESLGFRVNPKFKAELERAAPEPHAELRPAD